MQKNLWRVRCETALPCCGVTGRNAHRGGSLGFFPRFTCTFIAFLSLKRPTDELLRLTGSLFFRPQGIYYKRIKREADRGGYVLRNRKLQWWVRRQGVLQANQPQSSTAGSRCSPPKLTKIDRVQTSPLPPWLCLHHSSWSILSLN